MQSPRWVLEGMDDSGSQSSGARAERQLSRASDLITVRTCTFSCCPLPSPLLNHHIHTHLQASAPCFAGVATSPDMTATQLRVPAGLLPASATITYSISLTARKGSRSDSDTVTVRVLEGAAPVGTLARFCPGAAGCRSKAHLASEPLRLLFTVDDPSLLPGTTFQWESADVALPATGRQVGRREGEPAQPWAALEVVRCRQMLQLGCMSSKRLSLLANRQSLVIQPYTADGTPSFAGHTVMINVTATAGG